MGSRQKAAASDARSKGVRRDKTSSGDGRLIRRETRGWSPTVYRRRSWRQREMSPGGRLQGRRAEAAHLCLRGQNPVVKATSQSAGASRAAMILINNFYKTSMISWI